MKTTTKLLLGLFLTVSMFCYLSCKKTDTFAVPEKTNNNLIEERFFNAHRTADPTEKVLVNFLKKVNDKDKFVEQTAKQIGFPRWDKSFTRKQAPPLNSIQANFTGDSTDIYYIPFVRDSQNFVNATMIIAANATDTSISYKLDWQYATLQNSTTSISDSAELLAVFFMFMDKSVFGYREFNITDSTLFKTNEHKVKKVKLNDVVANSNSSNLLTVIEYCQDVAISYTDCPYSGHCAGPGGSCDNCQLCTSSISWTYCWEEWSDTGGGGGGTSPGGTGGGGSGGGSSTPPTPCGGTTNNPQPFARGNSSGGNQSNINEPCGGTGSGGWTPIPIDDEPLSLSQQLDLIATGGDSYTFQNIDPSSLSFQSVAEFSAYMSSVTNHQTTFDNTIPPIIINQTQKTEKARINLIYVGGVDISISLTKSGTTWSAGSVTSSDWGVTFSWSWSHDHADISTNSTEIIVDVFGYINYNVFVEGVGTVYKDAKHYRVKLNKQTGSITSISEI